MGVASTDALPPPLKRRLYACRRRRGADTVLVRKVHTASTASTAAATAPIAVTAPPPPDTNLHSEFIGLSILELRNRQGEVGGPLGREGEGAARRTKGGHADNILVHAGACNEGGRAGFRGWWRGGDSLDISRGTYS